ncbi:glycosyl hydrolase family 18 protein [Allosphingosinicella flava]|nr:glycosyl hydrolase family 18 protein [Sphingosinicella flava]
MVRNLTLGLTALMLVSCGGDKGSSPPPPPPPTVAVAITPATANVLTNGTAQFQCTVTGSTNTACNWSATGGTVSAAGLYTAPANGGTYTVTAAAAADATKTATATVTVAAPVSVTINPVTANVETGTTRQFTCTVAGSANPNCNWSTSGGTISATGLYTAPSTPGTYTVTAAAAADTTKTATAAVTVIQGVSVAITPATVNLDADRTQQFQCTVTGSPNTACTWSVQEGAIGGTVSTSGYYNPPTPTETGGTYHVVATSVADPTKTAVATVNVGPRPTLSISATGQPDGVWIRLQPSATQQFTCTLRGVSNATCSLSVPAGQGTITPSGGTTGLYTAPATPGQYSVIATASHDPSFRAIATVIVDPAAPRQPWVNGYYAGYFWDQMYQPQEVDMTAMTHIVLARVAPGGGSIPEPGKGPGDIVLAGGTFHDSTNPGSPQAGVSVEDWLIARAHAAGTKAILMFGGDGLDGIGFNLSSADNLRPRFVKNIVDYLVLHRYDGIDVDWENRLADGCSAQDCGTAIPGTESVRRLKALIHEIRAEANARPFYQGTPILITFSAYTVKKGQQPDQYQVDVANMVDQYNMMSYGVGSTWVGGGWGSWLNSPIFGAYWRTDPGNTPKTNDAPVDLNSSIVAYELAGVVNARQKIGIGMGFYGTAYGLGLVDGNGNPGRTPRLNTENVQYYNPPEQGFEYNMMKELGYIDNGQMVFDEEAQAIYRTYPAAEFPQGYIPPPSTGIHHNRRGIAYVTYENGRSIQAKGNWVRGGGAGGVIIWMINYGDTGNSNTLMADVKCSFLQRACPGPMTP